MARFGRRRQGWKGRRALVFLELAQGIPESQHALREVARRHRRGHGVQKAVNEANLGVLWDAELHPEIIVAADRFGDLLGVDPARGGVPHRPSVKPQCRSIETDLLVRGDSRSPWRRFRRFLLAQLPEIGADHLLGAVRTICKLVVNGDIVQEPCHLSHNVAGLQTSA